MKRLGVLVRTHPLTSAAFALALLLTIFFAVRTAAFAIYWSDPAHRDHAIRGWMTPGYVAHSWSVPRDLMLEAIGPLPDVRRPTLNEIAADQNVDLATLVQRIEAAIASYREAGGE